MLRVYMGNKLLCLHQILYRFVLCTNGRCTHSSSFQKQLFAAVLQNRCSKIFCNIHRKTPVLKSLFKNPTQVFTEIVFEIFRNRFFIEHFWWLLLKKCFITIHSTENTSNREEILNGKLHFLCNKASIIFWAYLYFIKIICRVWDRYRISSNKRRTFGYPH